ncbi:DB module domain-containing protein [Ditylenchus destructor]|nr:DB module domain-containing protein [Ditylenchus destructor]
MFDCRRIHARYCCSSRVRYSCPELCGNNPCLNPFPIQPFQRGNGNGQAPPPSQPFQPPPQPFQPQPSPNLPGLPILPPLLIPNGVLPNTDQWSGSPQFPPSTGVQPSPSGIQWPPYTGQVPTGSHTWRTKTEPTDFRGPPQPPPGIMLPPSDTDEAVGTPVPLGTEEGGGSIDGREMGGGQDRSISVSSTGGAGQVEVLPAIDTSVSTSPFIGERPNLEFKYVDSTPFPTLLPWSATQAPLPNPSGPPGSRPTGQVSQIGENFGQVAPTSVVAPTRNKNGAIDGEIHTGFTGQGASRVGQSRKGVIPPPQTVGPESQGELEMIPSESERASVQMESNHGNSGWDAVPPLPVHPGSTWIPLKFNVHMSEEKRTTVAFNSGDTLATAVPNAESVPPIQSASNSANTNSGSVNVEPSGYRPTSVLISRRGDLPLPTEEDRSHLSHTGVDEKWVALGGSGKEIAVNNTHQTGAKTSDLAGVNNLNNTGIFGDKINVVIDQVFNQQTINALTALVGRKPHHSSSHRASKTNALIPSQTPQPPQIPSLPPAPLQPNTVISTTGTQVASCGVAPDFRPCVPTEIASRRLLQCCQQKLMPPGCLELCRYDITQPEIKKAFDAGKCGILNVAPFLECASQGQDNLNCCKHRNVAGKSGPQCEVFCNPTGKTGLGSLGIQHLTCQSVIGDLLQCHHSGLRDV